MAEKVGTVGSAIEDSGRKSREIDAVTTRISESLAAFRTEKGPKIVPTGAARRPGP